MVISIFKGNCASVYSFNEIFGAELGFEKFPGSSEELFSCVFIDLFQGIRVHSLTALLFFLLL